MKRLKSILHRKETSIMLSIILAIGLASLFRKACKSKDCIVYKAKSFSDMRKELYKNNDECYQVKMNMKECDQTKEIIDVEK